MLSNSNRESQVQKLAMYQTEKKDLSFWEEAMTHVPLSDRKTLKLEISNKTKNPQSLSYLDNSKEIVLLNTFGRHENFCALGCLSSDSPCSEDGWELLSPLQCLSARIISMHHHTPHHTLKK